MNAMASHKDSDLFLCPSIILCSRTSTESLLGRQQHSRQVVTAAQSVAVGHF
ncbi:hypothetical protein DPMN_034993 [Dreissena polymorpha]|uniref:Uncharacterized protein n=1 Tax=Dreissena polymorpha TaxID=45954 RepID=A0A9D4M9Q1_DREPO|nr:hypothetical protein DPMN_034993 [Dreissena polymorpha]